VTSEFAQFSGSPLPDGIKPPRRSSGYADLLAVRLGRLAAGRSTGILPFSGLSDGAIYLSGGYVVGAESSRTPGFPVAWPRASSSQVGLASATSARAGHLDAAGAAEGPAQDGGEAADHRPDSRAATGPAAAANTGKRESDLLDRLLRVEPAIDAVLDLVLSQSAIGRFRTGKGRGGPELISLPAESLVTEIARRLHLVRQMAAVVTADTTVSRSPALQADRVQVSALQWALLIRTGSATTPRTLACALGRSVFGITTEVYQLVAQYLLSVVGQVGGVPDLNQRDAVGPLEPCPGGISFLRAVPYERGDNGMPKLSEVLHRVGGGG
jgi:hypothetical protein